MEEAVGAISTAILVVNNLRDYSTDQKANKRTLVVRFGRSFGVLEYLVLLAVAYAVPTLLVRDHGTRALLPWMSLPFAVYLGQKVIGSLGMSAREAAESLNPVLKRTAGLLLVHSLLLGMAIWM